MSRPRPVSPPPRVGLISLGCAKALVDSERLATRLAAEGYRFAASLGQADVVLITTCGFLDSAREESLAAIEEAASTGRPVVVTGCLGSEAELIRSRCPEVAAVTGPEAVDEVLAAVHRLAPKPHDPLLDLVPPQGLRFTPKHYAYLKIAEGCDRRCSFCIIPKLRGRQRSRSAASVLAEAERLVQAGVRELLVIAQDTAAYGSDLRYAESRLRGRPLRAHIVDLARALGELGVWVRLHYLYPYPLLDRLVELMAEGVVLPYLDVPLQHASPRILRAMRRPAQSARMLDRIRRWRAICPELAIRSTFIVGFPGESEEDFQLLLDWLCEAQLDRVGCFVYEDVAGAAANRLSGHVPEEVKEERRARLMELQARISREKLKARIGREEEVLVDRVEDGAAYARSYAESPEIDGFIRIRPAARLQPGLRLRVRITAATTHDLDAEPLSAAPDPAS